MGRGVMAPYREAPRIARFVCAACYRTLSVRPGRCPNCHVERLDLARPDVREAVRGEGERWLERRANRERAFIVILSLAAGIAFAVVAYLLFNQFVDDPILGFRLLVVAGLFFGVVSGTAMMRLYVRFKPAAAMALYATRRQRLALELGRDVGLQTQEPGASDEALARGATAIDPEVADVNELLRAMGATVEE